MNPLFLVLYSSNYLIAFSFKVYALSANSSLSPSILNLGKTDFNAYFGSFLALTVLIKSGKSKLFSFFMAWMKFLC